MSHKVILQILLMSLLFKIQVVKAADCSPDQFKCQDGGCILQSKLCDDQFDCADKSDENDCDLKTCRKPDWFQCDLPNGPCISSNLICNRIENCPGGEDELDCFVRKNGSSADYGTGGWHSSKRNCSKYEFSCQSDHSCVPLNFMCDGKEDCHDGSDETNGCLKAKAKCTGFFCHNKRCLESKRWLCDGTDDCGDGSDEMNCADLCTPKMGKFLCHNNVTCLPLEKVCDGKTDCPDQTDESINCTATNFCQNKTCPPASKCQMMPHSDPECICPKGFSHSQDKDVCVDINECYEQYGICSQNCINIPGTFKCTCHEDYTLREDNRTCEANGEEALLLYTTQVTVMGVNLRSKKVYTVAKNLSKVIGVSYDGEHIYWTNLQQEGESIVRANRNGSQPEILLTCGLDAPEDLAVDWLTGNIYFSDNVMHHLAVCSNDGHICAVLVTDYVHQPRGVALWPQRSQIFWTDWGINPMIARASMDGTNSVRLVTEKIHWPNGIALDMYNDRIYWVDAKLSTIESMRSDGTDRRMVMDGILKHPYGLAIFEDYLYWSDWGTKSIHSCNKFTGKNHKVLTKDRTIYAVHIYHSSKQKKIPHACEKSRCSHLCLLAENNSYSCACPDGMEIGPDRLRCLKTYKKQRLFLGIRRNLLEMEHTTFGRHSITKTHKLHMYIHEMAYNSVNNSIFVADNYQRTIGEVHMQSNFVNILVKGNLGNITALAFDHLSYNLYWSDSERHVVEVFSLQTKHRAVVSFFSGLDAPIGLAIIPEDGKMFIALKNRRYIHIDHKSLNGLGEHSHVFEDELGDDYIKFATDDETNTIYWADSDLGHISYSNYHNLYAYTFRSRLKRPYSIALVGEDLFWSELKSNTIHWTHKSNMGPLKRFDIEGSSEIYETHVLPTNIPLAASRQRQIADHPCQHWNGGCSHVCVNLGNSISGCLCPAGLLFKDAKNRSCIEALDCEFRCRSGECLTLTHKCNNRIDCPDASDEDGCDLEKNQKPKFVCPVGKFMCHNAEQCLEADKRCDGKKQCSDGTDEDHCDKFDKTKYCHRHQHACDNGNCVDFSVMCDGVNDCGDNSDEEQCKLAPDKDVSQRPVCGKDMFQCNSGTCIAKSWECDGKIDCTDSSDEHDKCSFVDCPSDMHRCLLNQCIDKRLVCDGHNDCGDLSDEMNCDMLMAEKRNISCGDERHPMYKCPNEPNVCLDLSAKCNGTAECAHGEDEADCDSICKIYEYQCKTSKECVRNEFRCDNDRDCADGSDEENCKGHVTWNSSMSNPSHKKLCGPKMWDCRDGDCVDETRVCDGVEDCDTGADEGPLCKTACQPVNGRGPCDNKCKATPSGSVCSCFSGYKLFSDHRSCFDINECEELDPCAQICENTHGSYKCSCYPDFMLRPDKTTCKSIESEKSLLFSTYDEVRSMTEQPVMLKVAWKSNDSKINSFDLNVRTRQAYFTLDNENILYKIDVDTAEVKSALSLPMPDTVAVDWITDNVYVKSRSQVHEIQVCSFSAKMCGTILKVKPYETIKTLAVDAYNRRLFFVVVYAQAYGTHKSHIVTARLDGSKRETLLAREMSFITTLACDPYRKILYFTDMHRKSLQAISYRVGTKGSATTILQNARNIIMYPSGLTWYENQVFIVNLGAKEAIRCTVYGTKECKAFNLNILNAQNILIDGASRQPMRRDPCHMAKCRGMCVQTEFSYECMCGSNVVSETKYCHASNEISSSSLLIRRSDEEQNSSRAKALAWCLIITFLLVLCAVALIYYRRKTPGHRNFIRNLHFQNPMRSLKLHCSNKTEQLGDQLTSSGNDRSSGRSMRAAFKVKREKLFLGSKIHRLFCGSKASHATEMEAAKPHEVYEIDRQQQQCVPNFLLENSDHDNTIIMGDNNDDATARLVP